MDDVGVPLFSETSTCFCGTYQNGWMVYFMEKSLLRYFDDLGGKNDFRKHPHGFGVHTKMMDGLFHGKIPIKIFR